MPQDSKHSRIIVLELLSPALSRASIPPHQVDDSLNIIDRGVVDSLGFLELISRIEHRAGVELDLFDADPDLLTTVGGLIDLLAEAAETELS